MKRYIFSVLFLAFLSTAYSQNGKLKIATYNTKNDTQKTEPWINLRQFGARDFLEHYQMDIIGTQEFFHHQLKYIVDSIPTKYKYAGVIRKEKEEYNAILYKEEKVRLLDTGTFWLSDTPDIPGSKFQGIDYDYIRICTWAKFQVKENGFTFFFFNTHVDYTNTLIQIKSNELILKKITEIAGNFPVILTGDFNYSHTSDPYNIMIGVCGFSDSYNIALQNASPWVTSTGNGFTFGYTTDPAGRIDHIFLKGSNNHDFIVNKYTISDFYYTDNNGKKRYPSDHFPVIIELEYKKIE